MSFPSIEEYRREVDRLLHACVDQKLLRGGTKDAIAYAQQAYKIAKVNNVPSPWPEIAAYRLAHLKMRSSAIDCDALREIDSLFAEASRSDRVGPIPLIYRLAVLHRLILALIDKKEISQVEVQFEEVYRKALGLLRSTQYGSESLKGDRIERQSAAFNMLEFAAYMSGRSYDDSLEGVSVLSPMDSFRKGSWSVVGKNIDQICMTEKMARWEFDERAAKNPELVLIELVNDEEAHIRLSGDQEWNPVNSDQAKLILTLLQSPDISRIDLERKVVGTDGENPSGRFRQVKKRLRTKLQEITGNSSFEVFEGDHLRNDVPILGLMRHSTRR
jgi:hypothetical protein